MPSSSGRPCAGASLIRLGTSIASNQTMILAQALAEYGGTAALAEGLSHLSLQLGHALSEWRTEAIVAVAVAAVLWKIVTATK